MELKLFIRQTKIFNAQQQEVYIAGGNPQTLQIYTGGLPSPRQWANYNQFIDVTDSVSDLFKLKLTWTLQRDSLGLITPSIDNQKKAASSFLTFEGEAYDLLKKWLIDDVSAPLNKVDVQMEHVGVGVYMDWSITATDLSWCEDRECTFDLAMRQKDESLTCVKQTLITDDWQGWFPLDRKVPRNGKKHPRFSYCNEARPNSTLIVIWWLLILNMPIFFVVGALIAIVWNTIMAIFIAVLAIVKFFVNILGGDPSKIQTHIDDLKNSAIDLKDIKEITGTLFVESSGCGREHPAPLLRDYIQNVCDKCGVKVTPKSFPLFFSTTYNIQTSADKQNGEGAHEHWNPYYNACYLGAVAQKGIRRTDKLSLTQGAVPNTTDFWLPQNSPNNSLSQLLDELKGLYNSEWRVTNNTLYFQRKDYWLDENYAFDFSKGTPDRNLLIQGLCFEWDEVKDPVTIKGLYSLDAADTTGNDATHYMNQSLSFGNTLLHPNLDGDLDKTTQFGATKFRLDGAASDYILDAFQQLSNSSFTTGVVWAGAVVRDIDNYMSEFADYALLIKQETTTLPKVLLWDGQSYTNAKALKPHSTGSLQGGRVPPSPNSQYNKQSLQWMQLYLPDTSVLGSTNPSVFHFTVANRTGLASTITKVPMLVNYPMYFAPEFKDSLWDWFHWIDDPTYNPVLHQTFTAKLELCADTLKRVKPFNDGSDIILGQKIYLPTGFYIDAHITEVTVSYDTSDSLGQHIEIKGRS